MSSTSACTACKCKEFQKHKWKKSDQCISCKHSSAQHGITSSNSDDEKVNSKNKSQKTTEKKAEAVPQQTISFANRKEAVGELTEYLQECKIESSGFADVEQGETNSVTLLLYTCIQYNRLNHMYDIPH